MTRAGAPAPRPTTVPCVDCGADTRDWVATSDGAVCPGSHARRMARATLGNEIADLKRELAAARAVVEAGRQVAAVEGHQFQWCEKPYRADARCGCSLDDLRAALAAYDRSASGGEGR